MTWSWILLIVFGCLAVFAAWFHHYLMRKYLPYVARIFQERPLFIIPVGQPIPDAEDVSLITADGLTLKGCYLKARPPRKGVILYGIEFGASRWSCFPACEFLRDAGYDIFAFEMRGQGESPAQAGYVPLQWVTEYEIEDFQTAIEYLKKRPDANPLGIGFYGLSKGGSAGLHVGAADPWLRCFATDGAFAHLSVMLPYMKQWIYIYTRLPWVVKLIPHFYFVHAARRAVRIVSRERGPHYPELEGVLDQLAPRPWLMIHGGADNYIKPDMARELFEASHGPKEFWLVEGAKHNQAMQTANGEYKKRLIAFFDQHLLPSATPRFDIPTVEAAAAPTMQERSLLAAGK